MSSKTKNHEVPIILNYCKKCCNFRLTVLVGAPPPPTINPVLFVSSWVLYHLPELELDSRRAPSPPPWRSGNTWYSVKYQLVSILNIFTEHEYISKLYTSYLTGWIKTTRFTGCIRRYRILYRVYIQDTLQGVSGDTEYFTGCIRRYRILYRVY